MPVRLFVGNLPYDATEAELREHFSAVGTLSYVYLPTDRETGKPRGFAFIEFNDSAQAQEAVRQFDGQLFKGRPIAVNEARAKEQGTRPSPPPRSSFSGPAVSPGSGIAPPPRGEKAGRDFGPDAAPRRSKNKPKSGPKGERVPKGPMREERREEMI